MDWKPTPPPTQFPTVNHSYRWAKWVTKQELEKCCAEGHCLHCRGSEHWIKDCLYQPTQHLPVGQIKHMVTPLLEESDEETGRLKVPKQGKE